MTARNEGMLIRFKVFTTEIDELTMERLSGHPVIKDISPDDKKHAL
ncbi:hypothetical protein [Vibrio maerlii]|nr:hypothetical protein [Vibrio maerlii]